MVGKFSKIQIAEGIRFLDKLYIKKKFFLIGSLHSVFVQIFL